MYNLPTLSQLILISLLQSYRFYFPAIFHFFKESQKMMGLHTDYFYELWVRKCIRYLFCFFITHALTLCVSELAALDYTNVPKLVDAFIFKALPDNMSYFSFLLCLGCYIKGIEDYKRQNLLFMGKGNNCVLSC